MKGKIHLGGRAALGARTSRPRALLAPAQPVFHPVGASDIESPRTGRPRSQGEPPSVANRFHSGLLAVLALAFLAGCTIGPRYQRSPAPAPAAWRAEAPWRAADPKDEIPKGNWWALFNDPKLDALEQEALAANQTLQAASERVAQARASATVVSSRFFPQLIGQAGTGRQRISANRPLVAPPSFAITQDTFQLPFAINYEMDVFGSVRGSMESANAALQATVADFENARLVVTAELAADYFALRELDAEIAVVQQAAATQQGALDLVRAREQGGIASGLEVAQQESMLNATRAQIDLLARQRVQYEHAIAVLIGAPASSTTVAAGSLTKQLPAIPLGVPSDVLERRPDVASAERAMAATNAQAGVARAAFFPSVVLPLSIGLQTRDIATLVAAPSTFWGFGLSAAQNLLNGGKVHAQLDLASAAYHAAVANYRQSVLVAFQQVEDGISALDALAKAAESQDEAVRASERALEQANNRYMGGLVSYLDVINAQQSLLGNQRLATQLMGQRLTTSVYLVKALGGGWDASSLDAMRVKPEKHQALQR